LRVSQAAAIRADRPGRLLGNMCVGIVETGRVGRAVIRVFRTLGSTVLAYDPSLEPADAAALEVEAVSLEELLPRADNVILSPHTAGHTRDTHLRQGSAMVAEVRRFLRGEPLQYEIAPQMLPIIA
jgi:phosphoglycerate dehydrogenase-like enzyme